MAASILLVHLLKTLACIHLTVADHFCFITSGNTVGSQPVRRWEGHSDGQLAGAQGPPRWAAAGATWQRVICARETWPDATPSSAHGQPRANDHRRRSSFRRRVGTLSRVHQRVPRSVEGSRVLQRVPRSVVGNYASWQFSQNRKVLDVERFSM